MLPLFGRTNYLACTGATFCLVGFLIICCHNVIHEEVLKKVLLLRPNSTNFEFWKDSNMPIGFDVYFFNWTNPEEVGNHDKKPNLVEVGPYCFRMNIKKVNTIYNDNNDTLSYRTQKTWFFDESKSKGSLQDKVIQLNTVAVAASHKIRFWDEYLQQFASDQLDDLSSKISIKKTVDELLFTGFQDSFMDMAREFAMDEDPAPFDKFGWFYMRNGSTAFDGYSNIETGVNNLNSLGKINWWNYKEQTDFYKSPHNFLEGGAGDYIFPPHLNKDPIKFFSIDLCQTISNAFVGEVDHKGIDGYKFRIDQKTLGDNSKLCDASEPSEEISEEVFPSDQKKTTNDDLSTVDEDYMEWWDPNTENDDLFKKTADNAASLNFKETVDMNELYTSPPLATISNSDLYIDGLTTDQLPVEDSEDENPCHCNGECAPMGLINVTACQYGIPLFISLPHFYRGDPKLVNAVTGLKPRQKDHDFYFVVEPSTGIALDVCIRMQVNIMLRSSKNVRMLKQTPKRIFFPMFWFEARAGIPDDKVFPVLVLINLPTILLILGIVLMFIGVLVLVMLTCIRNSNRQLQLQQNLKNEKLDVSNQIFMVDPNFKGEISILTPY